MPNFKVRSSINLYGRVEFKKNARSLQRNRGGKIKKLPYIYSAAVFNNNFFVTIREIRSHNVFVINLFPKDKLQRTLYERTGIPAFS